MVESPVVARMGYRAYVAELEACVAELRCAVEEEIGRGRSGVLLSHRVRELEVALREGQESLRAASAAAGSGHQHRLHPAASASPFSTDVSAAAGAGEEGGGGGSGSGGTARKRKHDASAAPAAATALRLQGGGGWDCSRGVGKRARTMPACSAARSGGLLQ
eukprot:Rhum_TRINITY_DN14841_c1_g1::Rhum_TRINITY_DN14841_c1_g1_i1::g.122369::m.122369